MDIVFDKFRTYAFSGQFFHTHDLISFDKANKFMACLNSDNMPLEQSQDYVISKNLQCYTDNKRFKNLNNSWGLCRNDLHNFRTYAILADSFGIPW